MNKKKQMQISYMMKSQKETMKQFERGSVCKNKEAKK